MTTKPSPLPKPLTPGPHTLAHAESNLLSVSESDFLSLYLCKRRGVRIDATDLNDYFIQEFERLRAAEGLTESRYRPSVEDGRKLSFAPSTFDAAYAISVLEHIPEEGDTACLRELARVLRPGGRCLVTVPFAPQGREEFRRPDFYWAGPTVTPTAGPAAAGAAPVFYQRRYDEASLRRRLIEPSGLRTVSLAYIGERVLTRAPRVQLVDFLKPWSGPLHPLLAWVCLTRPRADWKSLKKPLCAVIVLEKP